MMFISHVKIYNKNKLISNFALTKTNVTNGVQLEKVE